MPKSRLTLLPRWLLVLVPMLGLLMAAQVGTNLKPAAVGMTEAAQKFMSLLGEQEKQSVSFPFDHAERTAWYFVPLQDKDKKPTRKGLRLEVMNEAQRAAAMSLVQSALSEVGIRKVETIMSLENVLIDQEQGKGPVRNPGWYFVTIFGTPSMQGAWGWRIEGHHLSLNFTLKDGKVASFTPAFFGSNPGEVKAGAKQGTRPLATTLDRGLAVMKSLNEAQTKLALQSKAFPEVQGQTVTAKITEPVGVPYKQLNADQQLLVRQLADCYLENFHPDLQKSEKERLDTAGWDDMLFAYSGKPEAGSPVTYRLHSPQLLVEFINLQSDGAGNKFNHYHTCWRTLPSDFGMKTAAK